MNLLAPTVPRGRWIPSAIDRLLAEPHAHGFFQALRLLERWLVREQGLNPDAALARVRFRTSLALRFAPAEIDSLRQISGSELGLDPRDTAFELEQSFFGFTGTQGTLPLFYTELLLETDGRHGTARAFLEVFLQRITLQLYRAWGKHRLALRHEQEPGLHYLAPLLALGGMGTEAQRQTCPRIGDEALAFFAQHLQRSTLNAGALERLLAQYFQVPVRVEAFVGQWASLAPDQQSRLGRPGFAVGQGALVGARVWLRDQRVRLRFGPLDAAALQRFLPGGTAQAALKQWLHLLSGHSLSYEVRLQLRAADVRPARLGQSARLNHDSFLLSRAANSDRDEPGYTLLAA